MPSHRCPECAAEIDVQFLNCPHCDAVIQTERPSQASGYEWKSKALWLGRPFVHVAFGMDSEGKLRTACGVVAIGQRAVGAVAIGIMASGLISFGVVSLGVFSFGVVALGFGVALGVNAAAPLAIGVVAIGWKAGGVAAIGKKILFSVAH